jgi:tRNA G18 (ribose-2'-O)-methylase SpoU
MPRVIAIADLADPRVDVFRNVRDADLRGRDGLFMAESELVIRRLLRTPERLHALLLSPQKLERMRDAFVHVSDELPVLVAPLDLMVTITGFPIHRGALAAGTRRRPEELTIDAALGHLRRQPSFQVLLCEALTNVDNMGGIFRNAAAFGVNGVVLDGACCDPLYRKAIRVSMGHSLSVPYAVCRDWTADLQRLKREWGVRLIGAEAAPGARPLWLAGVDDGGERRSLDRVGVVFGSEGPGLSENARACCDELVQIPMAPGVPSLNVAVASAVILYELQRRREEHG